ncbi:hypothetical protein TW95_gp1046 [Pandoravirus inopinatum]|uniref:Uncharacterized protein n=1 Tax=Pandoravirus inopinatum TaxID=1605721 RepID=A0A0B5J7E3_9VIRU|nr:hypothetical protein TW95_gp1046 [Pandoravirus inopinatum]AJF97780.1 hypothetical protein [Pandoravirus inopinatum]
MPLLMTIETDPVSCGPRRRSRSASLPLPIRRDFKPIVGTLSLAVHGTDRTTRPAPVRSTSTTASVMTATTLAGRARRKRTKAFLFREPSAASRAVAGALYS